MQQSNWTPCAEWDQLPLGTWLVKTDDEDRPYHVATAQRCGDGHVMVVVGNHFSFDMGNVIQYQAIEE